MQQCGQHCGAEVEISAEASPLPALRASGKEVAVRTLSKNWWLYGRSIQGVRKGRVTTSYQCLRPCMQACLLFIKFNVQKTFYFTASGIAYPMSKTHEQLDVCQSELVALLMCMAIIQCCHSHSHVSLTTPFVGGALLYPFCRGGK